MSRRVRRGLFAAALLSTAAGVVAVAPRDDAPRRRVAPPLAAASTTVPRADGSTTSLTAPPTSLTAPTAAPAAPPARRVSSTTVRAGPRPSPAAAGRCPVFPADNPWNTDISTAPQHPNSAAFVNSIGGGRHLHPDFGTFYDGGPIGIPFAHVGAGQPAVPVSFDYAEESDPGPYPIPPDAPIEGGAGSSGDRHVIVIDDAHCRLYELFDAHPQAGGWHAGSGAVFDLRSNRLRPDYWTSADAAGLPIYPGLVRYDEVQSGVINHAIRFTVSRTQRGFIHPATHFASSSTDANRPPMGLRFRMNASYSCASLSREAQVVCAALKKFGMIVADNGSDWFLSGQHDPRWNDDALGDLKSIPGSAFEAIDTGPIIH